MKNAYSAWCRKCYLEKGCSFDLVKSSRLQLLHEESQLRKWKGDGDGEDDNERQVTIHNRKNFWRIIIFLFSLTVYTYFFINRHTLQQPKSMFDLNSPTQTNNDTIQIDRYNVTGSFTAPFNWCVAIKSNCLTSNPTKTRSSKGYAASKTLSGFTESLLSGLAKGLKSRSQAQ